MLLRLALGLEPRIIRVLSAHVGWRCPSDSTPRLMESLRALDATVRLSGHGFSLGSSATDHPMCTQSLRATLCLIGANPVPDGHGVGVQLRRWRRALSLQAAIGADSRRRSGRGEDARALLRPQSSAVLAARRFGGLDLHELVAPAASLDDSVRSTWSLSCRPLRSHAASRAGTPGVPLLQCARCELSLSHALTRTSLAPKSLRCHQVAESARGRPRRDCSHSLEPRPFSTGFEPRPRLRFLRAWSADTRISGGLQRPRVGDAFANEGRFAARARSQGHKRGVGAVADSAPRFNAVL